jgi:hypothetical protein
MIPRRPQAECVGLKDQINTLRVNFPAVSGADKLDCAHPVKGVEGNKLHFVKTVAEGGQFSPEPISKRR